MYDLSWYFPGNDNLQAHETKVRDKLNDMLAADSETEKDNAETKLLRKIDDLLKQHRVVREGRFHREKFIL